MNKVQFKYYPTHCQLMRFGYRRKQFLSSAEGQRGTLLNECSTSFRILKIAQI